MELPLLVVEEEVEVVALPFLLEEELFFDAGLSEDLITSCFTIIAVSEEELFK